MSNFKILSWRERVTFWWDDDDVCFVLDQHAELDFRSASSLKQQYAGRHVAPLGHIILIPSQPVFALFPSCCILSGEATNTNCIVFGLTRPRIIARSIALEANTLIITTDAVIEAYIEICTDLNDLLETAYNKFVGTDYQNMTSKHFDFFFNTPNRVCGLQGFIQIAAEKYVTIGQVFLSNPWDVDDVWLQR
jgi:hypothetical protein